MLLSEKSQVLLKTAGWFAGRNVDTSVWEAALVKEGYPLFPCVSRFIAEFGGLHITYTYVPPIQLPFLGLPTHRTYECHFDVIRTINHTFFVNVKALSEYVGFALCPVGEFYYDGSPLLMAADGAVYAETEKTEMQIVGLTGTDAVETVLSLHPLRPLSPLLPDLPDTAKRKRQNSKQDVNDSINFSHAKPDRPR